MARPRSAFPRSGLHLALILGFTLLIFLLQLLGVFETQELGFLNLRFRLRGPLKAHPDITIVEIDDESITRIGHWPWPRSYHAGLLDVLSSYKPRLILYDVLFTESSTDDNEDNLLAYAMKKAGNFIGAFYFQSEKPFSAFFPIPPFRNAAWMLGFVNIYPDQDGQIRRIKAFVDPKEGGPYYHTSVQAVLSRFPSGKEGFDWLKKIPLDHENSFLINFPGEYFRFPRISFSRVIEKEGTEDPELRALIEGKIVVVGQIATGGGDFRPAPFSPSYPGVGIQASSIHTLLTGQFLRPCNLFVSLGIYIFLTLLVLFLTWKYPPRPALLAVSILAVFYLGWNFLIFRVLGWILPVFPVLLVISGTYLLALFIQYLDVRLEGELLTRELSWAARIQENFLPRDSAKMEGVDVAFQCRFARVVGGDLYDCIPLGKGRLGICVGDVSGKGVPAALYMAKTISELRAIAKDHQSPSSLLEALNMRLFSDDGQGIFVTLLYLIIDLDSQSIFLSNAGHEPAFLYRGRAGSAQWIRGAGAQPLGLFPDLRYPEEKLSLEEGDFVVLISDGVRELLNPRGEEFGLKGAEKALVAIPRESAQEIVKRFFQAMDGFAKGNPAHDDRTVLCVKIGGGR